MKIFLQEFFWSNFRSISNFLFFTMRNIMVYDLFSCTRSYFPKFPHFAILGNGFSHPLGRVRVVSLIFSWLRARFRVRGFTIS